MNGQDSRLNVLRHWDVYACPGECVGRSGLWNVAPKDMRCPNCGGTVEAMRVYQQLGGAVSIDTAAEALTDALVGYDVPASRIVAEFRRLVADYANGGQ